jgi:hypothetical protein
MNKSFQKKKEKLGKKKKRRRSKLGCAAIHGYKALNIIRILVNREDTLYYFYL